MESIQIPYQRHNDRPVEDGGRWIRPSKYIFEENAKVCLAPWHFQFQPLLSGNPVPIKRNETKRRKQKGKCHCIIIGDFSQFATNSFAVKFCFEGVTGIHGWGWYKGRDEK